ncbi:MAG: type II and III secretion system protein family protein [Rhodomicrobiaceae bacterium]
MNLARIADGERAKRAGKNRSGDQKRRHSIFMGTVLAFATMIFGSLLLSSQAIAADTDAPKAAPGIYHVQASEDRIDIQVTLHRSETVRVGVPFSEALVGNAEVADVVPLTNRSIYIVGKKVGVTRLALLDEGKQMIGVVDIEVTHDLDGLRTRMKGNSALEGVVVQSVNGRMLLTGVVPDAVAMQHAITLAKQISIEDEITNAMRVAAPQQVMLEVRFIEANRSAAKALGVGAQVSSNNFLGATDSSLVGSLSPFGAAIGAIISGDTQVNVTLQALEERGLARRLAEPNLVALSGDTASFLAGGEFPFPVSSKDDQITVEFKKFGVGLAFTPTVLNDGQINLKIEPEVSNLDPTNSIRINNTEIPSLTVRRASTTVELRDGQSFAIAGLLQANHIRSARQLPWIGDVPILGALLRSAAWEKEETDLVIIITPRLVKPRAPGGKLATPLDKRIPTNEKEYFLTGREEVNIGKPDDYTGHILELTAEEPVENSWKGTYQ